MNGATEVEQNSFKITVTGAAANANATFTQIETVDTPSYEIIGSDIDGLTLNTDGSWTFDPTDSAYQDIAINTTRVVQVNYNVLDTNGGAHQNSFNITVTGANDAPVASVTSDLNGTPVSALLADATEDQSYSITKAQLLAGFTDVDGTEQASLAVTNLTSVRDSDDSAVGTLTPDGDNWTFTTTGNDEHFNGVVKLTYDVSDGTTTTAAINKFTVNPINDAPVYSAFDANGAANNTDFNVIVPTGNAANVYEDSTLIKVSRAQLLEGVTDVETTDANLVIENLTADKGSFTGPDGAGDYTYTPEADYNGTVTLIYAIKDEGDIRTYIDTKTFEISAVNDEPVRTAGNVSTLYLLEDDDVQSMGLEGLTYSTGGGSDESTGGTAQSFTYTVTAIPDGPNATNPRGIVFASNDASGVTGSGTATLSGDITTWDSTNANTFALVGDAIPGLAIAANGTFTLDLSDAAYTTDLAVGVDKAIQVKYSGNTDQNGFVINLTGTDGGNAVLASIYTPVAANDTLTLAQLQSLTFGGATNASGTAALTFTVADSGDGIAAVTNPVASQSYKSISETLDINIIGFNDAPVIPTGGVILTTAITGITADNTLDEDVNSGAGIVITKAQLLASVTDPDVYEDGTTADVNTLTVSDVNATNGTITDNNDDTYTFIPTADYSGTAKINYMVNDTNSGSVASQITLTVSAVNDNPVATFSAPQATAEGNASISGTLTATDVDPTDSHTYAFSSATINTLAPSTFSAEYNTNSSDADKATNVTTLDNGGVPGLTIDTNGTWSFDPQNDFYTPLSAGVDRSIVVTYQVTDDGTGALTDTETFTITVTGTNDVPVATFTTCLLYTSTLPTKRIV